MTADQRFLKAAHIRPDDPIKENWMEWRDQEVVELRGAVANWINRARDENARGNRWQLIAFGGWMLAAILFCIPLVERWMK